MSTSSQFRVIEKEFNPKYNNPNMKLLMEEQGWIYKETRGNNPVFKYIL